MNIKLRIDIIGELVFFLIKLVSDSLLRFINGVLVNDLHFCHQCYAMNSPIHGID